SRTWKTALFPHPRANFPPGRGGTPTALRRFMRSAVGFGFASCFVIACSIGGLGPSASGSEVAGGPEGKGSTGGAATDDDRGGGGRAADAALPSAVAASWLHTSGAKILDSNDNTVRLTGVSWFGLET